MRAVGYPEKYAEWAPKPCLACLEEQRGRVIMKVFLMREITEDYGTAVYACPRCMYQEVAGNVTLETLSRPTGKLFQIA